MVGSCNDKTQSPTSPSQPKSKALQPKAVLTQIQGEVQIKRAGRQAWKTASVGMALVTNDKLRTDRDGFATIQFDEGGDLVVEPESLISVTDLYFERRKRVRRSMFMLEEGRVEARLDIVKGNEADFRIKTPSAEARILKREVSFQ